MRLLLKLLVAIGQLEIYIVLATTLRGNPHHHHQQPVQTPTTSPTRQPIRHPTPRRLLSTPNPTRNPASTRKPSRYPTPRPTPAPSSSPSASSAPTASPSADPSSAPTVSGAPSRSSSPSTTVRWFPNMNFADVAAEPGGFDNFQANGTCVSSADRTGVRVEDVDTYDTQLECCREGLFGYFKYQKSKKCFNDLPVPPTASPTVTRWWPYYTGNWATSFCATNDTKAKGEGPYFDQFECCKDKFKYQTNKYCYTRMENAPTVSPTGVDGPNAWYPDYGSKLCTNKAPTPSYGTYPTKLECCQAYFKYETNKACFNDLDYYPTASPTTLGWWPYNTGVYGQAICATNSTKAQGGSKYSSYEECCKKAFRYEEPNKKNCLMQLYDPPTASPTGINGPEIWYPEPGKQYGDGTCINRPKAPAGTMTYDSQLECCQRAYASLSTGVCIGDLPDGQRPTVSPTGANGPDVWYPEPGKQYGDGTCINRPKAPAGIMTYGSQLECCQGAYAGQSTGACVGDLPDGQRPTVSLTPEGGPDIWYPGYSSDWRDGKCLNKRPAPNGVYTYDSQVECCKIAYGGQMSGKCFQSLPEEERPTVSPTPEGGPGLWYPDYSLGWDNGKCVNKGPVPDGIVRFDNQLECCIEVYGEQTSRVCLDSLPDGERPTVSPTPEGGPGLWYPDYSLGWDNGK